MATNAKSKMQAVNSPDFTEQVLISGQSLIELVMAEGEYLSRFEELAAMEASGQVFCMCDGCGMKGWLRGQDLVNGALVHAECEHVMPHVEGAQVNFFRAQPSEADRLLCELSEGLSDTLEKRDDKLDRMTALRNYWLAQSCHMHAEVERIQRAVRRKEAALDRLETLIRRWLEMLKGDKAKITLETYTGLTRLTYHETGTRAVEMLPGKTASDLPVTFTRQPDTPALEPDKEAILKLLSKDEANLSVQEQAQRAALLESVRLAPRKMALRWQ